MAHKSDGKTDNLAARRNYGNMETRRYYYCGQTGHIRKNCKKRAADESNRGQRFAATIAL